MFTVLSDADAALIEDVIPEVIETVTVRRAPQPVEEERPAGIAASTWDAEALREYVVAKIQQIHGPFPRNPKKEVGIMRSFVSRWGEQAGPIAQYAFEIENGIWHNAPISITRFCVSSDSYFGAVIAERLNTP